MENEVKVRKATDVLLELENKIDNLLKIITVQDLNIKVLSSKLNTLMELLEKNNKPLTPLELNVQYKQIQQQLIQDTKNIISGDPDLNIQLDVDPKGFSRTSRKETFEKPVQEVKQEPKQTKIAPPTTQNVVDVVAEEQGFTDITPSERSIPVKQRVVNKSGKAVFMADVEVFENQTGNKVQKVRTNGNGVWQTSLQPGKYKIVIKKKSLDEKEKIEAHQDLFVDETDQKLELQMLIIK